MTKQELQNKLQDIEWEDFEVKLAIGGVPKSVSAYIWDRRKKWYF